MMKGSPLYLPWMLFQDLEYKIQGFRSRMFHSFKDQKKKKKIPWNKKKGKIFLQNKKKETQKKNEFIWNALTAYFLIKFPFPLFESKIEFTEEYKSSPTEWYTFRHKCNMYNFGSFFLKTTT